MLRRSLFLLPLLAIFLPTSLLGSKGGDLYTDWHSTMKEWLATVNLRTGPENYNAREPALWQTTKTCWHRFESYVDKYYKGQPNEQ